MLDEDELRIAVLSQHLDEVDYYALLEVPRDATSDELHHAFHSFALRFHPDRHTEKPALQQRASKVFKRGNEAQRVLRNPTLRARYDQALARGELRLAPEQTVLPGGFAAQGRAQSGEVSTLEVPVAARAFYEKAVEAAGRGDVNAATMHLTLARGRAESPMFAQLEARIAELKSKPRKG